MDAATPPARPRPARRPATACPRRAPRDRVRRTPTSCPYPTAAPAPAPRVARAVRATATAGRGPRRCARGSGCAAPRRMRGRGGPGWRSAARTTAAGRRDPTPRSPARAARVPPARRATPPTALPSSSAAPPPAPARAPRRSNRRGASRATPPGRAVRFRSAVGSWFALDHCVMRAAGTRSPPSPSRPAPRCTARVSRRGCRDRPRWWWCNGRRSWRRTAPVRAARSR